MDETKNNSTLEQQKIEKELQELKNQYSSLMKEFKSLKEKDDQLNKLKDSVMSSQREFTEMNKSLQEITSKLNMMSERERKSMKNRGNILRRTAIKTVGSVLMVTDAAMRHVSMAREGIEDIVAEAQYENNRKRRHEPEYSE